MFKSLRIARKNYSKRNTDNNLKKFNDIKEAFDEERKLECQNFLINTAKTLNSSQAQRFWRNFNKVFKTKSVPKIDPLMNDGELLTENSDLDKCLFSVFFEAKHLIEGDFDAAFYNEINNIYDQIIMTEGYEDDTSEEQRPHTSDLNREISTSLG